VKFVLGGLGGSVFIVVTKAGAGDDSFLKNNSRLLCNSIPVENTKIFL
jgi:hypothetical protein